MVALLDCRIDLLQCRIRAASMSHIIRYLVFAASGRRRCWASQWLLDGSTECVGSGFADAVEPPSHPS